MIVLVLVLYVCLYLHHPHAQATNSIARMQCADQEVNHTCVEIPNLQHCAEQQNPMQCADQEVNHKCVEIQNLQHCAEQQKSFVPPHLKHLDGTHHHKHT